MTAGIRVTVTGGAARMGDFSIGSNETVPGHLLVVQGTADIYGKLLGNLVTVDGDVVVHPGGVVSGDILTLGGEVRDEGGEIGGEVRTFRHLLRAERAAAGPGRAGAHGARDACSGGWPAWWASSSRSARSASAW